MVTRREESIRAKAKYTLNADPVFEEIEKCFGELIYPDATAEIDGNFLSINLDMDGVRYSTSYPAYQTDYGWDPPETDIEYCLDHSEEELKKIFIKDFEKMAGKDGTIELKLNVNVKDLFKIFALDIDYGE